MKLFKKIFSEKNKLSPETQKSEILYNKLQSALNDCINDIRDEEKKLIEIRSWENELIADIYFVPGEYWYDEKKYFDEIKKHPENSGIQESVKEKAEKLLAEYDEQRELINSKIQFLRTLKKKYEDLLCKLDDTVHKSLMLKSKDEYIKSLKKYRKKLKDVREKNEDFHKIYEESEHLKDINNEIKELEEDFLIKKEVNEYIKKISSGYFDDVNSGSGKLIKEEINRLKDDINK